MREIRNSKVAVIGGAGFIGSHLVDYLIDVRKCDVLVLDNLIVGKREFVHPKAKFIWCDITHSETQLRKIFESHGTEYVFNYAAEPYIPVSFERPLHVFDINARAALIVMNAAQEAGVKAILQVSSAEIYGNADGKLKEDTFVVPHSTYGASKMAADALVQVRFKEAQTPAIALRQFNVLGPRETHPYVITTIIDQIHANRQFRELEKTDSATIRLGNNSSRDFQYVEDAVSMAVSLLENGKFGEVYNMGSEETIKIYDLAHMVAEIMGVTLTIEEDPSRMRPWEIWHLQSDNEKLYGAIGKRERTPLRDAVMKTVKYFEESGSSWGF